MMGACVIDSKAHCFLCLDEIPAQVTANKSVPEELKVHSLQCLSRYLKLDMPNVFPEMERLPPQHLFAMVGMSKLKVELCAGCASINETFSNKYQRLEKIKMEVMSSLESIHKKLLKAEGSAVADKLRKIVKLEGTGDEWRTKLGMLDVARKNVIQNCSIKLRKTRPRIKMRNLTAKDIARSVRINKPNLERKSSSNFSNNRTPSGLNSPLRSLPCVPIYDEDDNYYMTVTPISEEVIKFELGEDDELSDNWRTDLDLDPLDFETTSGTLPFQQSTELPVTVKRESEANQNVVPVGNQNIVLHPTKPRRNSRVTENVEVKTTTVSRVKKKTPTITSNKSGNKVPSDNSTDSQGIDENIEVVLSKGKRKCKCMLCEMQFSDRWGTVRHIKAVHLKEKPHPCPICREAFSRKHGLQRHMNMHNHPGSKPYKYKCSSCSEGFSLKKTWKAHVDSHIRSQRQINLTRNRPYHCHICSMGYWRRDHLKRHLMVHGGIKLHKCNLCGKAYFRRYELANHQRMNHKGK